LINMKIDPDYPSLYLSAREAAAELGVSPATLYAYVSRGLIRSEAVGSTRTRRYRAEDVRALKNRRAPAGEGLALTTEPAVLDSAVSCLSEDGPIYRGVLAVELAAHATLEEVATLLWDENGRDPFAPQNLPITSAAMDEVRVASRAQPPLVRAITQLALASEGDLAAYNRSREGRARIGARLLRLLASAILDRPPSAIAVHQQLASAWAPDHRAAEELLRRALVLLADHELNPSTWTVRCAVSTGINLYDAVVAGLIALKGPRHGGAGALAARMIEQMAQCEVSRFVRDRVALGEAIPGFGHSVYRRGDARARDLLSALARAGADPRLAVEAPARISEATGLYPNIDFALAVLMHTLGLPPGHETALFAIARSCGWVAHAIEQLESGTLIRPRARYTGPAPGASRR
jgi:citrate synthase